MAQRGRPKKQMTDEVVARQMLSGERIRSHREAQTPSLTQVKLAQMLGIHELTLRRYEQGINPVPVRVAKSLEHILGCHQDYWLGLTDIEDKNEYVQRLKDAQELSDIWDEVNLAYAVKRAEESLASFIANYKTLFALCGYRLNYDFDCETFEVEDHKSGNKVGAFTWDEFESLVLELRNTIGYWGYKKTHS